MCETQIDYDFITNCSLLEFNICEDKYWYQFVKGTNIPFFGKTIWKEEEGGFLEKLGKRVKRTIKWNP